MKEQPTPSQTPEHILQIKAELFNQWAQLPPEHQASTILVLFGKVLEGEHGSWLVSATQLLWQDKFRPLGKLLPITGISRSQLANTGLADSEIAQLDDGDLRQIASDMLDHYTNDVFWEELEYVARSIMENKKKK